MHGANVMHMLLIGWLKAEKGQSIYYTINLKRKRHFIAG